MPFDVLGAATHVIGQDGSDPSGPHKNSKHAEEGKKKAPPKERLNRALKDQGTEVDCNADQ